MNSSHRDNNDVAGSYILLRYFKSHEINFVLQSIDLKNVDYNLILFYI